MIMIPKSRLLLCLLILVVAGCGAKSMKELIGVYSVSYAHGSETLTLNADNTFTQVYTQVGGGQSVTNSGNWEFWKSDGAILLRDAIEFESWSQQAKRTPDRIVWRIRIAKRFGKISLISGEEGVLEYDKIR